MITKKLLVFGIIAFIFVSMVMGKILSDSQFFKEKDTYEIKEKTSSTDNVECYNVYGDSTTIQTVFRNGEWYRDEVPVHQLLGEKCIDKKEGKAVDTTDKNKALEEYKVQYKEQRKSDLARMETGRIG